MRKTIFRLHAKTDMLYYLTILRAKATSVAPRPINIILLQPEIPHNTGAIGRVCVGLDCALHLIRPLGFALTEKAIQRAGMDYWEHLDLHLHDSLDDCMMETGLQPEQLFFFSTKTTRLYTDAAYTAPCGLVFGSESRGTPPELHAAYAERFVTLPMPGIHARSINLSNAVAIAAYEVHRQQTL